MAHDHPEPPVQLRYEIAQLRAMFDAGDLDGPMLCPDCNHDFLAPPDGGRLGHHLASLTRPHGGDCDTVVCPACDLRICVPGPVSG